jgi:ABC-type dipeptide/oligopeptide/nickel transport system ATPase component
MRGGARIEPILAVAGLTVRTKQQVTLIEEVSCSIHAGQILGLVGESGCGKTETSLALMRLLNPQTTDVTGDQRRTTYVYRHNFCHDFSPFLCESNEHSHLFSYSSISVLQLE